MKVFLGAVAFCLLVNSCSFFERAGLAVPKAQSSKSLEVVAAEFVLKPLRREVVLSLTVEFLQESTRGTSLRVTFPEKGSKNPTEVVTLVVAGESQLRARSSPLSDLKYLDSYPIRVELLSGGGEVLEEFTQYVRYEVPPGALERMGVTL